MAVQRPRHADLGVGHPLQQPARPLDPAQPRHPDRGLDGPPITSLVDEVPADVLRSSMRAELPHVLEGIRTWAPMGNAWTQRYIVSAYCRTLYTIHTGEVESKRGALEWGLKMLDQRWHPLIEQAIEDRDLGWDADAVPRPGSMEQALAFAAHVEGLA